MYLSKLLQRDLVFLGSSVNGRYFFKKQKDWKHTLYNMTKFYISIFCKQQQYSPEHWASSLFPTKAAPASLPSIPRAPSFLFSGHGSNLLMISRQCSLVTFVIWKSSRNAVLTINHSFSELSPSPSNNWADYPRWDWGFPVPQRDSHSCQSVSAQIRRGALCEKFLCYWQLPDARVLLCRSDLLLGTTERPNRTSFATNQWDLFSCRIRGLVCIIKGFFSFKIKQENVSSLCSRQKNLLVAGKQRNRT